ncbi:MAG: DUF1343 domain-containing protein [Saprospiraceae bacterium]|nr:DUF1343 domain-containing protein [Saprospiraceae bacterium]MBP6567181.1 DUF1343 domain-containing protein [Saprospiraceae bacterium]
MQLFIYSLFVVLLTTCQPEKEKIGFESNIATRDSTSIITGAERVAFYHPLLKDKKVALVVNQTSIVKDKHLIDTLLKLGVNIQVIFAPEHGIRGKADAGEIISDTKDSKTGLPVISLYGKKKKPLAEDLRNVDVILFDIQDVGVRFYTYISTLHYVMEACAENNLPLILLDRPNPNAYFVDGPMLDPAYKSFIGMHPVPVVYGMTIGEYAQMINGEGWLTNKANCKLTVIDCKNYTHDSYYELPVKPSPNLPNIRSVLLYPSTCFFEGTTLSLGRGTEKQFQVIGHPKISSAYSFTPMPNEGAKDPPLNGQKCYGTDLSNVTTGSIIQSKKIDLSYLLEYYKKMTDLNEKFFLDNNFIDKLAGSDQLRKQILAGKNEQEIKETWHPGLVAFHKIRAKYLIYK